MSCYVSVTWPFFLSRASRRFISKNALRDASRSLARVSQGRQRGQNQYAWGEPLAITPFNDLWHFWQMKAIRGCMSVFHEPKPAAHTTEPMVIQFTVGGSHHLKLLLAIASGFLDSVQGFTEICDFLLFGDAHTGPFWWMVDSKLTQHNII